MEIVSVLPFVLILGVFWLFVLRPQQRRNRELAQMQSALAVGNRVMLTSGIFGTITELTDTRVHVEVAPGMRLEVMRGAIATVDDPAQDPEPPAVEEA